jgi:DNA-binding IclR family transcriptional regulator
VVHQSPSATPTGALFWASEDGSKKSYDMSDIQVIQRVADILNAYGDGVTSVRLGGLARELGVQRSTLHRYLGSMTNAGLLTRTSDGAFALGPLLARIAALALDVNLEHEHLTATMRKLARATRLTAVRSVWNGMSPVVVQVQEPSTPTHVSVAPGTRLPITAAQTLVLLAYCADAEDRENVLSLLPDSDRAEMENAITTTRRDGATVGGRVSEGVRAIATAVLDSTGSAAMTLALIGTEATVRPTLESAEAKMLIEAASGLSTELGYRGEHPGLGSSGSLSAVQ